MQKPENCIITIFGASGDLTKRKLMPSLFDLYQKKLLPEKFAIIGLGRTPFTDEAFREKMYNDVKTFAKIEAEEQRVLKVFLENIHYLPMDINNADDYSKLKARLEELDSRVESGGNYIYYVATSPKFFELVSRHLGE